jgi:ribonucleoside-diphosphate reductase alpha chain
MAFIREHADAASEALAAGRGAFPAWEDSIYGPNAPKGAGAPPGTERGRGREVRPLRNSTRTTVAPTGTLSIIADCTGGIEPAFALAYTRQHFLDPKTPTTPVRLTEVNKVFEAVAREGGFYSPELVDHLAAGRSLHNRPEVPEDVKRRFVTAHEIAPEWHVRMQAAFQRHTDNAVSKTINFPREASVEDVAEAYRLAYREGCKGITIYRDGSRAGQVLSHIADGEGDLASAPVDGFAPSAAAPNRRHLPDERQSITHKFRVGEQEGFVTVGLFADGTPGEIFVTISKEGSTIRGLMDSVAMLTSYSLQYGVSLRTLVDKFKGVHFEPAGMTSNPDIPTATSLVDYIFRWLELRFLKEESIAPGLTPEETLALRTPSHRPNRGRRGRGSTTRAQRYIPPRPALPFSEIATGLLCPDCGSEVVFAEGCLICRSCGYTRCG